MLALVALLSGAAAQAADIGAAGVFGGLPAFPTAKAAPQTGAITLPSPMTADPLQPGMNRERPARKDGDLAFGAFQRGYFATALSEAMKRLQANPKDGAAMALVGELYAQGLAVKPDPAEAARWDKLASEQGNREATFAYAMALLQGKGVPKDREAARVLLEHAAEQGHAGALYNLGVIALEGDGRTRDFGLAAAYFQKAADAGDVDALFALATLTQGGRGVAQDLDRAATLMKQAADEKHVGAEVEFAIMAFNGKGTGKDEAEAARYFEKAAFEGNPIAENRLARLFAAGRGVPKDMIEAAHWHIMARAAGIADPWLDGQLDALSPLDKAKVEEIVRHQIGP